MTQPKIVPLLRQEVRIGIGLDFPVLDVDHTLLIGVGQIIENEQQLDALLELGIYRPAIWDSHHKVRGHEVDQFSQLQLAPDSPLHLRLAHDINSVFVAAMLVSWTEHGHLMVNASPELALPVGAQVEARILADQGVITFQSTVLSSDLTQDAHLILSYPVALNIHRLRKHLRITSTLPTSTTSNHHDKFDHEGVLVNLSVCGGLLETSQYFAKTGDEFLLRFVLPADGQEQTLILRAIVRNMHTCSDDVPMMRYGIEFLDTTPSEHALIEHYTFHSLLME